MILSFSMANIALFSIVNFHQSRIFDKELIKFDDYLVKKEESYSFIIDNNIDNKFTPDNFINSINGIINSKKVFCFTRSLITLPVIRENFGSEFYFIQSPLRGPPVV